MQRRNSRIHQILKNAGVIESASDEESDFDNIIENTPAASPEIVNLHTKSHRTVAVLGDEATHEVGETSVEAPPFSPLTPLVRLIEEKNVPVSPQSSPLPVMSPDMQKGIIFLAETQIDSDDSIHDPDYKETFDDDNSSSDRTDVSTSDKDTKRKKRFKRRQKNTVSPSIVNSTLEILDSREDENVILQTIENRSENCKDILQGAKENANYSSSPKKRKVSDPSNWKKNKEKMKRLKGESYTTRKGKIINARPLMPAKCANKLKHKCILYVPQTEREKIYTNFRNLPTLQEQRHFIISHVTKTNKKRDTTQGNSRRKFTQEYTLTVAEEKKNVCQDFFLNTLNITSGFVRGALKKKNQEGILDPEKRGKKPPPNKLTLEEEKHIRDHILSFPAVESHYCRQNTEIKYLDSSLNITTMFNEYKKACEATTMKIVSFEKYRSIFRQFKLKFHKPKKDLCKQCVAFKEMSNEEKEKKSEDHARHLSRRDEARKCRDDDKLDAKTDDTILSFNFDLEAVLNTPKGPSGPFFYVRKLAVYNLTIYNLGNQDVACYIWDETEGKRGTVEISTCINAYISAHNNVKAVKMMSDGCGGQQKNYHFCSMCLMTLKSHPTLQIIDHKFFETGHTHMECDSVHSKIETKSKNIPVYTPDGWVQVVRLARSNPSPFQVNTLVHDDFKDFGIVNQYQCKEKKIGINDAVWLQYRKECPDKIFLKESYDKEKPFEVLELKKKRGKSTTYPIQAYDKKFLISSKKKNDLLKLCADFQIPKSYHDYYKNLPSSDTIRDSLPEPDVEESD